MDGYMRHIGRVESGYEGTYLTFFSFRASENFFFVWKHPHETSMKWRFIVAGATVCDNVDSSRFMNEFNLDFECK
jgi:hypothetical protein